MTVVGEDAGSPAIPGESNFSLSRQARDNQKF